MPINHKMSLHDIIGDMDSKFGFLSQDIMFSDASYCLSTTSDLIQDKYFDLQRIQAANTFMNANIQFEEVS